MRRMNRRTFIGSSLAATLSAAAQPAWAALPLNPGSSKANLENPTRQIDRIGLQLYTVRAAMKTDFEGTIAKVAATGYKEVEFAGYFGRTPQQVKETLQRCGLVSPSAHLDYATVSNPDKWKQALDDAATIGQTFLVNPWIDPSMRNDPGVWKRIADTYNTAGAAARAHGIQFCYHNHNFEFYPSPGADGRQPFDVLLESCDPKLVKMELDLCWISAAGKDPLASLKASYDYISQLTF